MTDNNDDLDDLDVGADFEAEKPQRATFKDTWNSNPMLKIGAVVLGLAVLAFGYNVLIGFEDPQLNVSAVTAGAGGAASVVPGEEEADPEYRAAVENQNKQRAEEALNTGTSAMPTPIATAKSGSIEAPVAVQTKEDPLKEWRARTEAKRVLQEEQKPIEEEAPVPEIVPMVQPVRPQPVIAVDPNVAALLSGQMRVVIAQQIPLPAQAMRVTAEENEYTKMKKQKQAAAAAQNAASAAAPAMGPVLAGSAASLVSSASDPVAKDKVIISAGSIIYAQLLNDLNSDLKGPVLAQILSGPLQGGRAIGQYAVQQDEYLVLTFTKIVKDGVSYSINGIALDEKTTLAGHEGEVDHHYMRRVILPAAASFVQGYGSAVAETGTSTTVTGGGGVVAEEPEPDAKEELFQGLNLMSSRLGAYINAEAEKPVTVKMNRGVTMGILFTESLTTSSAR